jgi:hypothetical protein
MRSTVSRIGVFACAFCFSITVAQAQKVTVEIDNPWVRTLRVNLAPNEKFTMQPASVIVYLTDARVWVNRFDVAGANSYKAGETQYVDETGRRFEINLAGKPIEEVVIELKTGAPKPVSPPITLDPVKLDPKYHTVDFENDHVRVLRTVLEPHVKSPMHQHPPYVVVYVTELHTTMALSDGRLVDNIRRRGEVAWRDAMTHSTENIGNQTAMEIQVELK